MKASRYEQEFAQTRGVALRTWLVPRALLVADGRVRGVKFENPQGQTVELDADVVFKAIGQKVLWDGLGDTAEFIELKLDRIVVDEERKTALRGVWAGGDCVHGGSDLTVSAVQDGKVAALSIDRFLKGA
jgi:glutamate synthase (NADPH/NADH) small chain